MNVKLLKLVFTVGILSFIFIVSIQAEVINDNVTGEFESDGNFLEILSKPNNKIKFYLLAFWKAHIGEVCGTIPINNGKAVYKKGNCEITMIFSGNTIKVTQKGMM